MDGTNSLSAYVRAEASRLGVDEIVDCAIKFDCYYLSCPYDYQLMIFIETKYVSQILVFSYVENYPGFIKI